MDFTDTRSPRLPDPGHSGDPKHKPRLDTVAQKPGNMGRGAPASGPAVDAHRDNLSCTPGAQPPEETKGPCLREPHRVAGHVVEGEQEGWVRLPELRVAEPRRSPARF
jgi:hypothetical protein